MKTFYRIKEDGTVARGSGTVMPDGFTTDFSLIQLDEEGNFYEFYNEDLTPDLEKIQALAVLKMIADGEKLVAKYVQAFIDEYNKANSVNFTNVDSCNKYVAQTNYSHQQFCIDIVAFNCNVWETARSLYVDGTITSETTEEDFISLLPVLGDESE